MYSDFYIHIFLNLGEYINILKDTVMTDFDRTKELLDSLGITGYKIKKIKGGISITITADGCGKLVDGYFDFYTEYKFDDYGKFIGLGIWEGYEE